MLVTVTLPLTTIFTAPSSCSSHWTYEAEYYNNISGGLLIQNALGGFIDTLAFLPDSLITGECLLRKSTAQGLVQVDIQPRRCCRMAPLLMQYVARSKCLILQRSPDHSFD